ncbi:MAG TPA: ribonuclease J [Candidatus Fusicatenibacter intestinigallinarum]|uniref:Ribonuclease J n=1 Tax=Candidatus Fusicatenibacter intestinigallinarum TaxID=2838598 RepID=A0A9D2SMQ9_9FIRM|nr:ribonuclease J [Candidatus Fusicatenibacter intestinigallinarum]
MKKDNTSKLKIIPLGGLEQIGMNITAFEYEDSIIVVDCGLAFPEDDMLGIDLVIPDVTYLKNNINKVKGFVITHGHEDHIGALPYVLKEVNVPVYATKLTIGLIENKLKEHGLLRTTKRKTIRHGQSINLGAFRIEFIKTNHSIADAAALAIYSPAGIVVHTGDFKVDYTPVFGDAIDLQRFAEIGKKGVLALMCDSTNAERPGFTMSERTVGHTIDGLFAEHRNSRIIIATFASNVDRVQQIIYSAYKFGRKVVVEGRSMVNVISTAQELGYIQIPENTLIDIEQMKNYTDEQLVLITTGSQGESMAALSRMAAHLHKKVSIKPGDTVIFSSNPIPGNEKAVSNIINDLSEQGADVIFQNVHVSGHACQEEIKLIYSLVKPKYSIPVHGEYRHLKAHAGIAQSLGIPKDHIFLMHSGDVLSLDDSGAELAEGQAPTGAIMVDGLGVGDVGNIVLRDRQHLSEDGIMVVVLTLEKRSNQLLAGPDIVSRGFVYVRESEDLMGEAREVVEEALDSCLNRRISDWGKIKSAVKDALGDFVWKRTKRRPMILPIIMEA